MWHFIVVVAARFMKLAARFSGTNFRARTFTGTACILSGALVLLNLNSASALSIDFTAHACSPNVLDCAQTGPADGSVFNLSVNQTNAVTLRVVLTHFGSTLTADTLSFEVGQFAGVYQTVLGNQIALVFNGAGSLGMQLANIQLTNAGPAGSFSTSLFYSVPNAIAPLTLDAYFAVAAVPEPETYALLLAGLVLVSAMVRWRSQRLVATSAR